MIYGSILSDYKKISGGQIMNLKKIMAAILSVAIMGTTAPVTKKILSETIFNVSADEETDVTFDSWQEAYKCKLLEFMYTGPYSSKDENGDSMCSTYAVHDMNGDGIPELFINYQPITASASALYTFYDSKIIELAILPRTGFVSYCPDNNLLKTSGGGGAGGYVYTTYSQIVDGQMITVDSFGVSWGTDPPTYSRNDETISETEYNSGINQYESKNWVNVGRENYFDDLEYELNNIVYDYYFDYYKACYLKSTSTATTVSIPNNVNGVPVKEIDMYFLSGNEYVKTVNVPANAEMIVYPAFTNCSSLTAINIDSDNPNYTSEDGVMYDKNMTTLVEYPTAKDSSNFRIPQSVTEIGRYAFERCTGVKKIEIPKNVEIVRDCAFYCCPNLSSVTFLNPDCDIYDYWSTGNGITICNTYDYSTQEGNYLGVIQGYDDSIAEIFAETFGYTFVSLGANPNITTTTSTTTTSKPTTTTTNTTTTSATTTPPSIDKTYALGDVNGDGMIDSSDASAVLSEYALIQTGSSTSFSDNQKKAADVNNDGIIDSSDASCILSYYAYVSTGGTDSLKDFLNGSSSAPQPAGYNIYDYPEYVSRLNEIKEMIDSGADYFDYANRELSVSYSFEGEKGFTLIDLNEDGTPELITINGEMSFGESAISEIYTIYRGELVRLCSSTERLGYFMCENNIIGSSGSGGANIRGMSYSKYVFGSDIDTIGFLSCEYTNSGVIWTYKGDEITEEEAHEIQNKYIGIKLDMISLEEISSWNNGTPEAPDTPEFIDWQSAYKATIDSVIAEWGDNRDDITIIMPYLDNDDVPELCLVDSADEKHILYTFYNGSLREINRGSTANENSPTQYGEKTGYLVLMTAESFFDIGVKLCILENGSLNVYHELTQLIDEKTYERSFIIDGEFAEEEEFDALCNQWAELTQSEADRFTYNEAMDYIKSYT